MSVALEFCWESGADRTAFTARITALARFRCRRYASRKTLLVSDWLMDAMQQLSAAELIGQTYGFAVGTALAALLLVLVWRSGRTDRSPRFLFAVCILIANGSGLAKNVVLESGVPLQSVAVWQIKSFGFIA